jgi:hypothetical protein
MNGDGWIPIRFSDYPIIALSQLPIDPINQPPYYYSFVAGGSYKLSAKPEINYSAAINDGDIEPLLYEAGSNKKLSTFQSGLILYYDFDSIDPANGLVLDRSGFNNHGVINPTSSYPYNIPTCFGYPDFPPDCPQFVNGKIGRAVKLDGVDDSLSTKHYVDYQTYYNLDPNYSHTITVWIYTTSTFPYPYSPGIVESGCHFESYGARILSIENGKLCAQLHGSFNHICTQTGNLIDGNVATGTWQFLAWTHQKGSTVDKLGVNGQILSFNIATSSYNSCPYGWRVGFRLYGSYFPGLVDEFRVYNRALSDSEIKALYDATK